MLLLSIHPRFANAIFEGTKTVELRRRAPKLSADDKVIVYATVPRAEVIGTFTVDSVVSDTLGKLWQNTRANASVTKSEFDDYFHGMDTGVGIWVGKKILFPSPIPLSMLRELWPGFHPPQGFRYLTESQCEDLQKHGRRPIKQNRSKKRTRNHKAMMSADCT